MTLASDQGCPVLPRKTISSCCFADPGSWSSYKLLGSSAFRDAPGGTWDPIPGHSTRAEHPTSGPNTLAGTPPHQLSPVLATSHSPQARALWLSPWGWDPAGAKARRRLFRRLRDEDTNVPGKGRLGGRSTVPRGSSGSIIPRGS